MTKFRCTQILCSLAPISGNTNLIRNDAWVAKLCPFVSSLQISWLYAFIFELKYFMNEWDERKAHDTPFVMYLAEQRTRFIITIQLHPQIIIQSRFTSCIFLSFTAAVYHTPPNIPSYASKTTTKYPQLQIYLFLPHVPSIWCEDWPRRVVFLQYKSRTYSPFAFKITEKMVLYHIIETKGQTPQTNKPLDNVLTTEIILYLPGKTQQPVYHCIKMYSGFIDIHSICLHLRGGTPSIALH